MNLLKELMTSTINEGALKKELASAIDNQLKNAEKFTGAPYDECITVIANGIKDDYPKLASSITADDLMKAIRYNFDQERWEELSGKPVNEDEEATPNAEEAEQRLIKSAGNFKLVASADGEKIFLYDVSGKLLVDMPVVIWKQLQGEI